MPVTEIVLERQSANDETAVVAGIFAESGAFVKHDELLFEIENSKAVEEYRAPASGIVSHQLKSGQVLSFGILIATIAPAEQQRADSLVLIDQCQQGSTTPPCGRETSTDNSGDAHHSSGGRSNEGMAEAPRPSQAHSELIAPTPHASAAARALMNEHQLPIGAFTTVLITSADVMLRIAETSPAKDRQEIKASSTPFVRTDTVQPSHLRTPTMESGISLRKAAEIEALAGGAANGTLSVLGVRIGSLHVNRPAGDMLGGLITDLVIYEASRLMRAYPLLNGYFKDGCAIRHSDVNGGLAMDRGGQLVVCGIRNTDTISLPDLRTVMDSAVSRYMDDRLTSAEMQRATFTVSDLSSSGIDFMFPLLPKGQSLILGITRDGLGVFTLFAGFDHRMTEGLEVSRFLTDLRTRLQSFDDLTPALSEAGLHCHYCKDSLQDAQARSKQRGLLKLTISPTKEVLCCGSCWNGW